MNELKLVRLELRTEEQTHLKKKKNNDTMKIPLKEIYRNKSH